MPPQVDLETLVTTCGGGAVNDRKIACETPDQPHAPPDDPPESFWLSKDAEYDWFDRNAVLERKESTKGNNNNNNNNNNSNLNPNLNSVPQRNSLKVKSIIGLPKTHKSAFVDTKRRTCKPANIRLFPKRSDSVGKSMVEPGSPKVSCMGRVRSKRCRSRRRSNSSKRREKTDEDLRTGGEKKKTGFYSKIMSVFRPDKNRCKPIRTGSGKRTDKKPVHIPIEPARGSSVNGDVPGLGGMKHYASGRRSGSNADDFDWR